MNIEIVNEDELKKRQYLKHKKTYNGTNKCFRCEKSFDTLSEYQHPTREKDENGIFIGWDCPNCWEKYDPKSTSNKRKSETDCRNRNLDPNSNAGIGYISTILVKKFLGINNDCFDITDNFNYPGYDIKHEDFGLIDVKSSPVTYRNNHLGHRFEIRKNKKPDLFYCIGYDKDRKHVIAIFKIPNENNINNLTTIWIPFNGKSKYKIFKENEEEVKKWDNLFHTLKLNNCPVLRDDRK